MRGRGGKSNNALVSRLENVGLAWVKSGTIGIMPPWSSVKRSERICVECQQGFSAKRLSALFCSGRCRDRSRVRQPASPAQRRAWRLKRLTRPGYREHVNAISNARATRIRRWLDAQKLAAGCCDCGFRVHPSALHFDHISSNKTINVCNAKSITQAKKEISKCVVRCANCHAIKTWPHLLVHMSHEKCPL